MPAIAIVRGDYARILPAALPVLHSNGLRALEITLNSPGALETIAALASNTESVRIGAGTVLSAGDVQRAIAAGATYIVCPHTSVELIRAAHDQGVPILPGAFTPTEILAAFDAGADWVKWFPAMPSGVEYLKQLLGPLPHIPLVATGGVTPDNARAFLDAGAQAVALGSALINRAILEPNGMQVLALRVRGLKEALRPVA